MRGVLPRSCPMKKQSALLLAALVVIVGGAAFFLRSGDDTANPLTDGPTVAGPDAPQTEPAALAPVDAGHRKEDRIAAQATAVTAPADSTAADGAHPWQGQFAGVTGRLVEPDGTPAGGLTVELIEADGNMFSESVHHSLAIESLIVGKGTSNAEGVFRIEGARGEGFHGLTIDPGGGRSSLRLVEQSLTFGKITDIGDVVLDEYGVAFGTVIDDDGEPVAGARVRLAPVPEVLAQVGILDIREGSMFAFGDERIEVLDARRKFLAIMDRLPAATGMTDADGAFRIEGVPMGTISGGVDRKGHVCSTIATFEMTGEDHDVGEVELLFGRTATGKVVDAAGKAVAGIEVRAGTLHPMFQFGLLQEGVVTDESGRFAIGTIPEEGPIIGAARRWDGDPWTVARAVGSSEDVTIQLEMAAPLKIHLALEDGTPVGGGRFRLERVDGSGDVFRTAEEVMPMMKRPPVRNASAEPTPGQYEIAGVSMGNWIIEAQVEGMAPTVMEVIHTAESSPVALTMTGGKTLNLTVIDSVTREPLGAAHASLVIPGSALPVAVASGWSNDEGQIRLGPVASDLGQTSTARSVRLGKPGIVVERPGYAQNHLILESIDNPGPGALDHVIEMQPGGSIVGRVTWGGAAPEDRYMIGLDLRDSELPDIYAPRLAVTDAEGRFRIDGLIAGTYSGEVMERFLGGSPLGLFELEHEPERFARETVTVTAGAVTVWDLTLLPDGGVPKGWYEGRVLIDGAPPIGGMVHISQNQEKFEVPLDGTGSFRSPDLDAQGFQKVKITIQGTDENGDPEEEQIYNAWDRVPAGAAKEIFLEFRNTPLRVTVLNAATGEPVEGATVTHIQSRNYSKSRPTDENGLVTVRLRMGAESEDAKLSAKAKGFVETTEALPTTNLAAGFTIHIQPAVPCSGRVVLPSRNDNDYLIFTPEESDDFESTAWCEIEEDGSFSTEKLRVGTYKARLMSMDRNGKYLTIILGPNGDDGLVLDFTSL